MKFLYVILIVSFPLVLTARLKEDPNRFSYLNPYPRPVWIQSNSRFSDNFGRVKHAMADLYQETRPTYLSAYNDQKVQQISLLARDNEIRDLQGYHLRLTNVDQNPYTEYNFKENPQYNRDDDFVQKRLFDIQLKECTDQFFRCMDNTCLQSGNIEKRCQCSSRIRIFIEKSPDKFLTAKGLYRGDYNSIQYWTNFYRDKNTAKINRSTSCLTKNDQCIKFKDKLIYRYETAIEYDCKNWINKL
ncbi:MAG: hypothetical protein JJV93_00635 [Alphaproteobacteria bacterium]|nr:hypothetical protein [Alphaproteobacteria bacterium]MBL0717759.1 hypothetical protein [Alphaproteobacteria bacterium]